MADASYQRERWFQVLGISFMLCGQCIVHKQKPDSHHERHKIKVKVEGQKDGETRRLPWCGTIHNG